MQCRVMHVNKINILHVYTIYTYIYAYRENHSGKQAHMSHRTLFEKARGYHACALNIMVKSYGVVRRNRKQHVKQPFMANPRKFNRARRVCGAITNV